MDIDPLTSIGKGLFNQWVVNNYIQTKTVPRNSEKLLSE